MLHIVPQKRPTVQQLLRHSWFWQPPPQEIRQTTDTSSTNNSNREATAAIKGAVDATFRAIASPQAANVGPVGMSELAKRRAKDKPHMT